jgi:hypothetical protein
MDRLSSLENLGRAAPEEDYGRSGIIADYLRRNHGAILTSLLATGTRAQERLDFLEKAHVLHSKRFDSLENEGHTNPEHEGRLPAGRIGPTVVGTPAKGPSRSLGPAGHDSAFNWVKGVTDYMQGRFNGLPSEGAGGESARPPSATGKGPLDAYPPTARLVPEGFEGFLAERAATTTEPWNGGKGLCGGGRTQTEPAPTTAPHRP